MIIGSADSGQADPKVPPVQHRQQILERRKYKTSQPCIRRQGTHFLVTSPEAVTFSKTFPEVTSLLEASVLFTAKYDLLGGKAGSMQLPVA